MRIGMILDSSFPPDSRVENEAVSLINAGYEVFLFSLCYKNIFPREEVVNGIHVHRFHANKLTYKLSALAYTTLLYHAIVQPKIEEFLLLNNIDIIHVHDMVIAEAAYNANKKFGLPFILDLHENRPEIMQFYPHVNNLSGKLLINLENWKYKQQELMQKATRVILVTEEAKAYAVENDGLDPEDICVVPNSVSPEIFYSYPIDESIISKYQDSFMVLYTGDTGLRRGTDTAIKSLVHLKEKIPAIRLVLVGKSKKDDLLLNELARKLGVDQYVEFLGWQDVSLFPSYILASKLCLSPLHRNLHHDTTYANKIFQYMCMGRAQIVSDSPPQSNIIKREKCGLVHKAGDEKDLAEKILMLFDDEELRLGMEKIAKEAFLEKYTWSKLSNQLTELYKEYAQLPSKNPYKN
jgi:glycosyltransferase involved in cell wall biosynthesis